MSQRKVLGADDQIFIAQWGRTVIKAVYGTGAVLALMISAPYLAAHYPWAEGFPDGAAIVGPILLIWLSVQTHLEIRRTDKDIERREARDLE
jgi:hypothetical protein